MDNFPVNPCVYGSPISRLRYLVGFGVFARSIFREESPLLRPKDAIEREKFDFNLGVIGDFTEGLATDVIVGVRGDFNVAVKGDASVEDIVDLVSGKICSKPFFFSYSAKILAAKVS